MNSSLDQSPRRAALSRPLTLAALLLAFVAGPALRAQTSIHWTGGASTTDWNTPGNWNTAALPTSSDDVLIDNGGTVMITTGGTTAGLTLGSTGTGSLTVQDASGASSSLSVNAGSSFTVTGAGSSWYVYSAMSIQGAGSSVTISNEGALAATGSIYLDYGGNITVTGAGSIWNHSGNLDLYTASLLIDDHAIVMTGGTTLASNSVGNVASATVTNGAQWTANSLAVGGAGQATLDIESGGRLAVTNSLYLSNGTMTVESGGTVTSNYGGIGDSGGTGTVTVDGAGSTWTIGGELDVGSNSNGSLTISHGGVVTDHGSNIGYFSGGSGTVTVTGTGSVWNTQGLRLGVDFNTQGSLTIENGGKVFNTVASIGMSQATGAVTSLTVTGAGSTLTTTGLQVGNTGSATATVSAGGLITGGSGSIGGPDFGSGIGTGTVTVTGTNSRWNMPSGLSMSGASTLNIADGGTVTSGGVLAGNYNGDVSTINLTGTGSNWAVTGGLVLGESGAATLNVGAGTSVSTSLFLRLGQSAGGTGTIIQTGGTVTVGGALQFNPGTSVYRLEGGTLKIGLGGIATPTGAYTFELAGGTIQATTTSVTSNPNVTLRTGTVSTLSTPDSATQRISWSGTTSGSGGLLKTGAGVLNLNATNNTFSGGLTIQQGTVNPIASGSLGTGPLTFSGDSRLQVDFANITFTGGVTINPSVTGTFDVAGGRTLTLSGGITGAGALTKTSVVSPGTLVLSGTNDYTGATTISAGTVKFTNTSAFYNSTPASWTDTNLVVNSGATAVFNVGGAGEFTAGNIDTIKGLGSATGGFKAGSTLGLDTTNAGGNFTYAGTISDPNAGANALSLAKFGTGSLTLTGPNTYTGTTTVGAGTIIVGHNSALGTGAIALSGGTLGSDGTNRTLANAVNLTASSGLGGSGNLVLSGLLTNSATTTLAVTNPGTTTLGSINLTNSATPRTVTFNITGGATSVAGTIANGGAGAGSLTKTGSGTLTLSGANTYTGTTIVSAGTLQLSGAGTLGATTSAVIVSGVLDLGGLSRTNGTVTISGTIQNGTITASSYTGQSGTASAILAGAGGLTKNNSTTLTLSGANTYAGATTISGGILSVSNLQNGGTASSIGQSASTATNLVLNGTTLRYTGGAQSTDRLFSFNTAGGALDASGTGALSFTNTGALGFVNNGPRTLTLTGTNTGANSLAALIANQGPNATSLAKSGAGAWSVTGANTYTGGTTIDAGTLFANNTTGSALGTGAVTVSSGATLGGGGSIGGLTTLASGAHLAPGNSPGTLTFTAGLTLQSGTILDLQLGTISDLIVVSGGTLTGSTGTGGITLNLSDSGGFTAGTRTLLNYTTAAGTSGFDLADFAFGSTLAGYNYSLGFNGNTLELTATTAIPEPSTYAAALASVALLVAGYHRRKRTIHATRN